MPQWLQLAAGNPADRPGKAAVAEWNQFYQALLAHENGHKRIYEAYVKKVQTAVDAYAKTVYWAEVCYGPGRSMKVHAFNRARELAREEKTHGRDALIRKLRGVWTEHENAQRQYDRKTRGGRNQSAVGGKDVKIDGTVPLQ